VADLRVLKVSGTAGAPVNLRVLKVSGTASGPNSLRVLKISGTITAAPLANAGTDQTVDAYDPITLSGALSQNAGSYSWSQVSGSPTVTLSGASTATATFTAPATQAGTTLVFRLTCGASTDDVTVTVRCHNHWTYNGSTWVPLNR
jgi:hypothetical protein